MDIITKMKQIHLYSNNEQEIISYLLNYPEKLKDLTAGELAKLTYTSTSSVVRLAQKLGYRGYNDFKIAYISEFVNSKKTLQYIDANFPFKQNDDIFTIAKNISILSIEAINESLSLVDLDNYNRAVDLLDQAAVIDIYGPGSNQYLAYNFMMPLKRIKKQVNIPFSHQEFIANALSSDATHAALVITYTGEMKEVIEYCKLLRQTNTPIIGITSIGDNSISQLCDITLNIATQEKIYSKIGTFSSKNAIMYVLNILYAGIFVKNYEQNMENLLGHKKRATNFNSKIKPLKEDK